MKCLEVPMLGVFLEPAHGFRRSVHSWLAVAFGLLQIGKVLPLDPFIFGVVFAQGFISLFQVTV
jgi:hypothetical protein